jgi:hypothetical protein
MFWIFTAFAGLMALAVTLGQISVWFAVLKFALIVAVGVILAMGIALIFRKPKQNPNQ